MKKVPVGPLAVLVVSLSLLTVLSGGDPPPSAPAVEGPPRSVKGLKLAVHPDGRYFVDQHGKPFFYLGDTAWLIFQRLDREEVEAYLKDRASKGFTVLQAYVLRGLGPRHPDGSDRKSVV